MKFLIRNYTKLLESSLTSKPIAMTRLLIWAGALATAILLAMFRVATDAEFAFMTFIIVPVIALAWMVSGRQGIAFSAIATLFWLVSDIGAGKVYSASWVPVLNMVTRFGVYALIALLVSMLRQVLERERQLARHDMLTGLMNRRAFLHEGQEETLRANRYEHPITVVFLDLDNFKQLNDTRGHDAGDAALRLVAQTMLQSTRRSDRVARLGGDEFAILLPETGPESARETGSKLADAINDALKKEFAPVSVSIGVACFESVTKQFETMIKEADALMYEIKSSGKQGVRFKCFGKDSPLKQDYL